jgi:hypothetical protein
MIALQFFSDMGHFSIERRLETLDEFIYSHTGTKGALTWVPLDLDAAYSSPDFSSPESQILAPSLVDEMQNVLSAGIAIHSIDDQPFTGL